ncbi:hypothetical protein [Streptosporangium roseum]|uniref:hypothetical protein n=1 Tax=Streptosporangium roseum TaxID=2001 RepID=UPI0001A3D63C|nr:hypothetical protein [Streptosporangium roseum]
MAIIWSRTAPAGGERRELRGRWGARLSVLIVALAVFLRSAETGVPQVETTCADIAWLVEEDDNAHRPTIDGALLLAARLTGVIPTHDVLSRPLMGGVVDSRA